MNFQDLEKKYQTDLAFNKMVNCFLQMIEEHGFIPSEIREGLFFAQWKFEMNNVRQVIKTQEDWEKISEMREILKAKFGVSNDPKP